ncbi:hypothetical protein ACG7TL_007789 [Trametes sanguinea]
MSELEFYFAEQQAIMNMPEEDITDYLARRRRSRADGSYTFDPDSVIVDNDTSTLSYANPSTSHRRTTSVSGVSKHHLETPQHAETPQEHSRTPQEPGGLPQECSPVNQPSHAVAHVDALVGGKRQTNKHDLSPRMRKKRRREEEAINASADFTSQAPPHLTAAESNSGPGASVPETARAKTLSTTGVRRNNGNATKRVTTKAVKTKGKGKKELITPLEYAERLQAGFSEQAVKKKKHSDKPFLKGKRIFYYGGDLNYAGPQTRNRMDIITRHGGTLVPKYDPAEITHIVTDADERVFLRAIGLKKLSDIPQHIPTVKWSWVVSGFDRAPVRRSAEASGKGKAREKAVGQDLMSNVEDDEEYEYPMGHEFEHAAFKDRIDAGRTPWGEVAKLRAEKGAKKDQSTSKVRGGTGQCSGPGLQDHSAEDISNISDFTQDIEPPRGAATITVPEGLPSPPSSPEQPRLHSAHTLVSEDAARTTHTAPQAAPSREPIRDGESHAGHQARSASVSNSSTDPLAEFYATARAERDAEMFKVDGPDNESMPVPNGVRRAAVQKGFLCDDKGGAQRLAACPNQDVIDKLQELKSLHAVKPSKDDEWRVLGYNKAIAALRKYPTRIKSYEEAVAIRGVGSKTAQKIMEIIETGELRRIEHERTGDVEVIQSFLGIYGVGLNTAFKWYNNGCRTLDDIAARKGGIKLSTEQKIGLKYYKDINTRIPRAEVEEIYNKVKATALTIDPKLFIEIMGSFRRGKADCGDIDVLITRPTDDGKTHQGVLRRLLRELHQQGIITEDLCLPEDFDDLELVYRGLCRKDANSPRRRIGMCHFLTVPWKSRGAALLYYTGDDIFNRSLRLKANKMGYSLNQRGLYAGVIRNPSDKRQKLDNGQLIASESEREILDILGVPWQEPHERVLDYACPVPNASVPVSTFYVRVPWEFNALRDLHMSGPLKRCPVRGWELGLGAFCVTIKTSTIAAPAKALSGSSLFPALVVFVLFLTTDNDAAAMEDEQHQFVHAKLPVHSQYDRDRLLNRLLAPLTLFSFAFMLADRRPIDPPPIVQLRVIDPSTRRPQSSSSRASSPVHMPSIILLLSPAGVLIADMADSASPPSAQSFLQNPYYFMFASLAKPDEDVELHWLKDGKTRCTTGSVVSSLYHLKDTENQNQDAGFFVFPDLSVRTEGSYRLKLSLFEVVGSSVYHCKSIFSAPFYVYTAKKFPGMEESTPLSCSLADQGIKIRIRKDIRVRKRPVPALDAPVPMPIGPVGTFGPVPVPIPDDEPEREKERERERERERDRDDERDRERERDQDRRDSTDSQGGPSSGPALSRRDSMEGRSAKRSRGEDSAIEEAGPSGAQVGWNTIDPALGAPSHGSAPVQGTGVSAHASAPVDPPHYASAPAPAAAYDHRYSAPGPAPAHQYHYDPHNQHSPPAPTHHYAPPPPQHHYSHVAPSHHHPPPAPASYPSYSAQPAPPAPAPAQAQAPTGPPPQSWGAPSAPPTQTYDPYAHHPQHQQHHYAPPPPQPHHGHQGPPPPTSAPPPRYDYGSYAQPPPPHQQQSGYASYYDHHPHQQHHSAGPPPPPQMQPPPPHNGHGGHHAVHPGHHPGYPPPPPSPPPAPTQQPYASEYASSGSGAGASGGVSGYARGYNNAPPMAPQYSSYASSASQPPPLHSQPSRSHSQHGASAGHSTHPGHGGHYQLSPPTHPHQSQGYSGYPPPPPAGGPGSGGEGGWGGYGGPPPGPPPPAGHGGSYGAVAPEYGGYTGPGASGPPPASGAGLTRIQLAPLRVGGGSSPPGSSAGPGSASGPGAERMAAGGGMGKKNPLSIGNIISDDSA